jgi:HTH-type transcriptional regulator/antitoxin HigA
MFDIGPLKNESDYGGALKAIAGYFRTEPAPGSIDADRFDMLARIIADYEAKHWAIEVAAGRFLSGLVDRSEMAEFYAS